VASGVPPQILIGRAVPHEGLSLPWDPDASRTHASLMERDGAWWLEDANSRNGTFIGEFTGSVRVSAPVRLAQYQVFRVGLTRLRIESSESADAVAEASATGG
jgi:pSer/pThr/pTyr-binding forkhead associated (FHA) protein